MSPRTTPSILVVCTGNTCRSPIAELLLAAALDPALAIRVMSAGTLAAAGAPIEPKMLQLLGRDGVEAGGFASQRLTPALVGAASVILTMTREHRAATVAMCPRAVRRVFTLKEFAAIVGAPEASVVVAEAEVEARLSSALTWAQGHRAALAASNPLLKLDIDDPYGRGRRAYRRTADEISAAVRAISAVLNGSGGAARVAPMSRSRGIRG